MASSSSRLSHLTAMDSFFFFPPDCRDVSVTGNGSWSLYGAERSQPMETGRKSDGHANGPNWAKSIAVGCHRLPGW
jgi:hypothetical protein